MLETERLLLRPWREEDAPYLHEFAKDPRVGPRAGWRPHKNVAESLLVIRMVLAKELNYAITLKDYEDMPIGSISLVAREESLTDMPENHMEMGFWIGVPFWGQGYMVEAVQSVIAFAFLSLDAEGIWCGYMDGNLQSKRVQEKCGFQFQRTDPSVDFPCLKEKRMVHRSCLTRSEWLKERHP